MQPPPTPPYEVSDGGQIRNVLKVLHNQSRSVFLGLDHSCRTVVLLCQYETIIPNKNTFKTFASNSVATKIMFSSPETLQRPLGLLRRLIYDAISQCMQNGSLVPWNVCSFDRKKGPCSSGLAGNKMSLLLGF